MSRFQLRVPPALAALRLVLTRPRSLVPTLTVRDVSQLDFVRLRARGVTGIVFDKDDCLTPPLRDELAPELTDAWTELNRVFGPSRILICSNAAGTRSDPGLIMAEAVSRSLSVPVLVHCAKKPTKACARLVVSHFAERGAVIVDIARDPDARDAAALDDRPPVLAVVGDRHSTDVLLGERIRQVLRPSGIGPDPVVTILTTRLWRRARPGIALLRLFERALASLAAWRLPADRRIASARFADCVKPIVPARPLVTAGRDWRALVPRSLLAVGFRRPLVWRGVRDWRQLGWYAAGVSATPSQAERLAGAPALRPSAVASSITAALMHFRRAVSERLRFVR